MVGGGEPNSGPHVAARWNITLGAACVLQVDALNAKFVEARDEIEYAMEVRASSQPAWLLNKRSCQRPGGENCCTTGVPTSLPVGFPSIAAGCGDRLLQRERK